MKPFETIIIDTGGALVTLLQDYAMRMDFVNKTKSGTISQKGFGAVKAEFQRLTNWLKTMLRKNIIYVFHSVEEKTKESVVQRLLCEGSAKNIVWQPCDFGGYVYMNGDRRMIGLSPTDEYFAKGCYGIQGVREVPTLGPTDKNDFISRLFDEARANVAKDSAYFQEEKKQYEKVMEQGRAFIESLSLPQEFMDAKSEIKKLPHALTSYNELCSLCKDRLRELGFRWDPVKKGYVDPNMEETKKNGKEKANDILRELGVTGEKSGNGEAVEVASTKNSMQADSPQEKAKEKVFDEVSE